MRKSSAVLIGLTNTIVVGGTIATLLARHSSPGILSAYIALRLLLLVLIYLLGFWCFLRYGLSKQADPATLVAAPILGILILPLWWALATNPSAADVIWLQFQNTGAIFMPLALVGMFCISDYEWLPRTIKLLVNLGLVVAVVGILQWLIGYDTLRSIGTNIEIGDGGYGAHYGSALDSDGRPVFRAFSTLLNHYDVCAHLILSSLLLVYQFAMDQCTRRRFAISMTLMVFGILVTYNMTGWALMLISCMGATVGFVFFRKFKIKLQWWIAAGVVGLVGVAGLAGSQFAERLTTNSNMDLESGSSAASRFLLLFNCMRLMNLEPSGWGWATAQSDLPYAITTDNYFMWIGVFGGVWYLALTVGFLVATFGYALISLRRTIRHHAEVGYHQMTMMIWVWAATACGLSNFFVSKGFSVVAFFWLSVGMIWSIPGTVRRRYRE